MYPLRIDGIEKPTVWLSTVETQGGNITFKLDTEAEANVIPIEVFNQLTNRPEVQPTKTKLTAYGGTTIKPLGTCTRAVRLLEQLQLLVIVASQSQLCD